MAIQTGANVSKANGYAVTYPPDGASVAKANGYAVINIENWLGVSKANAYAVLAPPSMQNRAIVMCIT